MTSDLAESAIGKCQRYPSYKHSGVEWLGEIPAHWNVQRLKSFTTVQLSNVDKKSKEGEDKVRLCNYVDVYYNERIDKRIDFMPATATSEQVRRFSLRSGDVVITKDSETWTDIAVPAVVFEDLPGVLCGYHLAHIRPHAHCNGGFLSRSFSAIGPQDQYHITANGITRFGLTGESIRAGLFALPPLPEQCAIAAFLDRETAKIDALVAKKERLIELLQEKRAALISHTVTRGLPADAAAQAGLDPNVPMKDSGVEWLVTIPAHWDTKRLKTFSRIRYGLGQPPRESANGLPLIRATNVIRGRITEENMVYVDPEDVPTGRDAFLAEGEIIVVRSGAYTADSAIIPKAYDGAVAGYDMVVAANGALSEFVAAALLCTYVLDGQLVISSMRSAQPHLNAEELGAAVILLPPLHEQRAIADFLDRETAKIDALVTKVGEAIDSLKELREALISAAVTGKIDVRKSLR